MVQKNTPNCSSSFRARPANTWPTSWAHSMAGTGGSLTMVETAEGLAPGSGLEFLAVLPPGCHPWPWDEAAGGSWKKTDGEEWLLSRERWGQKGQGYWSGFEEPEIARHSRGFVSPMTFLQMCFSANYPLSFTWLCSPPVLELVLGPHDSGQATSIFIAIRNIEDGHLKILTRRFYTHDDTIHTGGAQKECATCLRLHSRTQSKQAKRTHNCLPSFSSPLGAALARLPARDPRRVGRPAA